MIERARFLRQMPLCYFSSTPSPSHSCVFALNHPPSIHIEAKLLTQTRLSFQWLIVQSMGDWIIRKKGTMTGMKIILIESCCGICLRRGLNGSLMCYRRHTFWAALFKRGERKIADLLDIPGCKVFQSCFSPRRLYNLFSCSTKYLLRNIPKVTMCTQFVYTVAALVIFFF